MTDEAWLAVVAAWPSLARSRVELARELELRAPAREHLADFCLAFACARSDPQAMAELESRFMPSVQSSLRRYPAAFVEELKQALRERLFLGPSPKIRAYAGRGPLGAWLRTVAARLACDLRSRERSEEVEPLPPPACPDPEVDLLKSRLLPVFRDALETSLRGLPVAERNRLRLHFLDGLTATQLAALEGVAVSTVTRALARTRRDLLDSTQRRVAQLLALSPRETLTALRLVRSNLEVSLSQLN